MADSGGGGEKTEKATPKRRKDSREKEGNVLQSKEIGIAVSTLGVFLVLGMLGKFLLQMFMNLTTEGIGAIGTEVTEANIRVILLNAIKYCVLIIGPVLLAAVVFAILPGIVQTRGLITFKPLKPQFSRMSPMQGIKKLFSLQSIVGILKGIVEIVVIIVLVYLEIQELLTDLLKLPDMTVMQGIVFIAKSVYSLVMTICILLVVVAAADFLFQWWQFEKKLKMSKQEIKDEYKQVEGDPQIKSKIKQKQREIAQGRMMQEVPDSDVIVRNPTHYAVALRYDKEGPLSAPKVVAKGQDNIAMKIIEIGEENNIYIVEDRPLARLLYSDVELGRQIPPELYTPVAIIMADMYEAKGLNISGQKKTTAQKTAAPFY